jgi:hypothetical protein
MIIVVAKYAVRTYELQSIKMRKNLSHPDPVILS